MGCTIDMKDFDRGFKKLVESAAPDDIRNGLFKAGNELLRDAIYERPYAPFDEGHLRGSARTEPPKETGGGSEMTVGFNIEYAARWHELSPEEDKRINWTLPGSGRKYLESKMTRYAKKYLEIIGEFLRRRLRG